MVKCFFDCEFTQLVPNTTLVSIGIVADNGKEFYAETTDYDQSLVNEWIEENVLENLLLNDFDIVNETVGALTMVKDTTEKVGLKLQEWLNTFDKVEMWSDVMHYDMYLFQGLMGGAFSVPSHVDYIGYDIATVMKMFGLDPDLSREAFIDRPIEGIKHNSLYDARVIQACYSKLQRNRDKYKIVL